MVIIWKKRRIWKKGKPKNITVPLDKSKSPYGNIKVVAPKGQKIKPKERKPFRKK